MQSNDDNRLLLIRIIDSLAKLYGIKRFELADVAGVTPTTMTHFLHGKSNSALSLAQLERVLEEVHVDLSPYLYRLQLAEEIAKQLNDNNFSVDEVIPWDQDMFVKNTKVKNHERRELYLFPDYDLKKFSDAYSRKLIDLSSSWPSFKATVIQYMKVYSLANKMTPAVVKTANQKLNENVGMNRKARQVSRVTKKDPDMGDVLGTIVSGVAGAVLALAACFLLNDDD